MVGIPVGTLPERSSASFQFAAPPLGKFAGSTQGFPFGSQSGKSGTGRFEGRDVLSTAPVSGPQFHKRVEPHPGRSCPCHGRAGSVATSSTAHDWPSCGDAGSCVCCEQQNGCAPMGGFGVQPGQ